MPDLRRFFGRRKNSRGPMEPNQRRVTAVRRLERRDALKRDDCDAASSCSSAEDLSVSSSSSSLYTRSLDIPPPASFRIGGGEGEMDRMFLSLGISNPEDLGIPLDAWQASKMRSSSDTLPRFRSLVFDGPKIPAEEVSEGGSSSRAVVGNSTNQNDTESTRPHSSELNEYRACSASGRGERGNEGLNSGSIRNMSHGNLSQASLIESKGSYFAAIGGGIKGMRPPVLKPPPPMNLPPIDQSYSSWDIARSFAPDSEPGCFPKANQRPISTSSSENGYSDDEDEGVGEEVDMEETEADGHDKSSVHQLVDTADESCSFTTNEFDTSSTMSNTSPNLPSLSIITSWQKGQRLGQGSFGTVYEGIAGDGDFVAIKEVSLLDQGSQAQECIQQLEWEITLLSQLNHPNIVRYRGTGKDESNLYIFLELVSKGSLLSLYKTYKLGDSQVSSYTRQILQGLKYLHDQNFIHRDIKCANILVDANGSVKLADFGLAKVTKLNDIKSCKGTPFWMAPEVLNRKLNDGYGRPADIWSLGCTVLEMLTRQIPYSDLESSYQAVYRIGRGMLPVVPDSLSSEARDFILRCLKVDPDERPTAAKLLNHPFVKRQLPCPSGSGSGSRSASPHLRGGGRG